MPNQKAWAQFESAKARETQRRSFRLPGYTYDAGAPRDGARGQAGQPGGMALARQTVAPFGRGRGGLRPYTTRPEQKPACPQNGPNLLEEFPIENSYIVPKSVDVSVSPGQIGCLRENRRFFVKMNFKTPGQRAANIGQLRPVFLKRALPLRF